MEAVDTLRPGNPGMPEYSQYDADSFGHVKCGKSSLPPHAHMRRSIQHFECCVKPKRWKIRVFFSFFNTFPYAFFICHRPSFVPKFP